jgi:hypothetical protein
VANQKAAQSAGDALAQAKRLLAQFAPNAVARDVDAVQRRNPPRHQYMPSPAGPLLPVQSVVDRTTVLEPMLVDTAITHNGKVLEILRYPVFGPYGPLPSDPARFADDVNPRTALCGVLAPYARAECVAHGGAW